MKHKLTNTTRSYHVQQIQQMDLSTPKRIEYDKDWNEKRGLSANALFHVFCQQVADFTGMLPLEVKAECKLDFGISILLDGGGNYAYLLNKGLAASGFWQLTREEQLKAIVDIPITSVMDTAQMSKLIELMQMSYGSQGIILESK